MSIVEPRTVPRDDSPGIGRSESLPEMSLMEHLTELRYRLLVSLAAVIAAAIAAWFVSRPIYEWLTRPVVRLLPEDADRLHYLSLTEPFVLYMKVAGLAGVFVASPVVLYQMWMFIAPGLYRNERRYVVPVVASSVLCFLAGGAFGYLVLFPMMAGFFLSIGAEFRQMLTVGNLFGFLIRTLLGCALLFEWPIVVFFLTRMGMVTARGMLKNFRYAIVIIFVVAAIVTPTPDMATQTILAGPMLLLYLIGIGISWAAAPGRPAG